MRAAVLVEQNQPLELADVEPPAELEHGQVLVKLLYSGVCGSQLGEIDGVKGPDRFLPHLLGHEGSGEVLEIGPGVTTVAPGDSVVLHWMSGSGIQSACPTYSWSDRTVNAGWVTTFNELAVVSENRVTTVPKELDVRIAPLLGCAVTTGIGVVNNEASLSIGESVLVIGAGGVGLNVIQAAALTAANPIVAVDVRENSLELAKQLGATHCINGSNGDLSQSLQEIFGSEGADVVIETTGKPEVMELAYESAAAESRVILVGVLKKGEKVKLYTMPLHFGKQLVGSRGGSSRPDRDIPRYIGLYERGLLNLDALVTNTYSLEQINDAIDDLRSGKIAGRCIIEIAQP